MRAARLPATSSDRSCRRDSWVSGARRCCHCRTSSSSRECTAADVADAYWRVFDQRAAGAFNLAAPPVMTPDGVAEAAPCAPDAAPTSAGTPGGRAHLAASSAAHRPGLDRPRCVGAGHGHDAGPRRARLGRPSGCPGRAGRDSHRHRRGVRHRQPRDGSPLGVVAPAPFRPNEADSPCSAASSAGWTTGAASSGSSWVVTRSRWRCWPTARPSSRCWCPTATAGWTTSSWASTTSPATWRRIRTSGRPSGASPTGSRGAVHPGRRRAPAARQRRAQLRCTAAPVGFDKALWSARGRECRRRSSSHHVSPDGDMGFPGQLTATVTFTVSGSRPARSTTTATTDRADRRQPDQPLLFQPRRRRARVPSRTTRCSCRRAVTPRSTPCLIPTGELAAVAGTPMDLRSFRPIGAALRDGQDDEQVRRAAGGFDHNWVIDGMPSAGRAAGSAGPRARRPAARSRSGPTSPACSSTRAAPGRDGGRQGRPRLPEGRRRSAWRPSTSRTPPTSRRSRRPCSAAGETFGPAPSSGSAERSADQLPHRRGEHLVVRVHVGLRRRRAHQGHVVERRQQDAPVGEVDVQVVVQVGVLGAM